VKKEQIERAVKQAAKRLLSGNNARTYGMDVEILAKHALGEDANFTIYAVEKVLVDPERTYA